MWSLDNYTSSQHHLRTYYKYKFMDHTQAYWIKTLGDRAQQSVLTRLLGDSDAYH